MNRVNAREFDTILKSLTLHSRVEIKFLGKITPTITLRQFNQMLHFFSRVANLVKTMNNSKLVAENLIHDS